MARALRELVTSSALAWLAGCGGGAPVSPAGPAPAAAAPQTPEAAAAGSAAGEGSSAKPAAPSAPPAPAPQNGPVPAPAALVDTLPPAGPGPSPAVIVEGVVASCLYDGHYVDGSSCPDTVFGVGVAPLETGPLQLVRGTAKTTRAGEAAGPCADLLEATGVGPRVPQALGRELTVLPNDNDRYQTILGEAYGLSRPNITALVRVDLEGDGTEEVLYALDSHPGTWPIGQTGLSYSYVGVRRIQAGSEGTVEHLNLFDHRQQMAGESPLEHLRGRLIGLTDHEGDGKLEVVVEGGYYEGRVWSVWRVEAGQAPVRLGGAGCGA